MTLASRTPATAVAADVAELPACDHCAEPVVAISYSGSWLWRHLDGYHRCAGRPGRFAQVAGSGAVETTIRITTDQRQED